MSGPEFTEVEQPFIDQPIRSQHGRLGWKHTTGNFDRPSVTERESFRELFFTADLKKELHDINLDDSSEPWLDDERIGARKGLLNSDGPLRKKSYFLPLAADANGESSEPYDASSALKVDSSGASGGSSAPYGGSSEAYDASSEPYDASSEPYDASSAVTRVRDSKRAPPELVGAAIEELCQGRYLSLDVLAGWLKRNRNTLRNLQVPRLISEGRLVLRYPDAPTHPQQAYRTKKELDS